MTKLEKMIIAAIQTRPQSWLNCSGIYIGEVLALQVKGFLESRIVLGQLQIRTKGILLPTKL